MPPDGLPQRGDRGLTGLGRSLFTPGFALGLLLAGFAARLVSVGAVGHLLWTAGLYSLGIPLLIRTSLGLLRGRFAADLVAALAILTAMLLAEPLAGLVIVLMQSGGEALEAYAVRRASDAVRALEAEAPRIAHRLPTGPDQDGAFDIPVDQALPGDRLLILPGEMIPCDGIVLGGVSSIDTARITGEPVPVPASPGVVVTSGSLNLDGPLTVRVEAPARESLYARIVELVRTAQESKAPLQRVADRYAIWFTPLTLLVCAAAWVASGDPVRVLAVLVVATPCPLLLATPVAIIGGINRAARRQVVVRHGGALEGLATVDVAVFDKTGTVTEGGPTLTEVEPAGTDPADSILQFAAALEEGSGHPLARAVIGERQRRGLARLPADGVREYAGRGVSGQVGGRAAVIGATSLIRELAPAAANQFEGRVASSTGLQAFLALDNAAAGTLTFHDRLRPDSARALRQLQSEGITRILLLSGDNHGRTESIARSLGIAEVQGDLLPGDKVEAIHRLQADGHRVLMVGDGTNDAPALATATVGIALAGHGGGISAAAADAVLLTDDLGRVPEVLGIARRTMAIARQSLWVGLGLSGAAMVVAALGHIPPAAGALLQEGIDVAVILNALRTSLPARGVARSLHGIPGIASPTAS